MSRISNITLIAIIAGVIFGSTPFGRSQALSIIQGTDRSLIVLVGGPVALGSNPARVTLAAVAVPNVDQKTLATRIETLAPDRHIYLVVRDLRVVGQPGVLFRLYLDLPPDAKPVKTDSHYVGSLNFYSAAEPGRFDAPNEKSPIFVSYDITRVLRNLQAQKLLRDQTTLTIIPTGTPVIDSNPRIGRIEIIEQ